MSFSNMLKTFETSIRLSMPDQNKTLAAWQNRAIITRSAYLQIKAEHDKEVDMLRDTYTPKAFEARVAPLDAELKEIEKIAKKRVQDDLDRTMAEKRNQLKKCLEPPTEDALRLLQVLNMRTDLTQREIDSAGEHLNSNIHGLRLLRDIAQRNGLYYPDAGNVDRIESDLTTAESFCRSVIDSMCSEDISDNYKSFAFWTHPGAGEMAYHIRTADSNFFTAAQVREAADKQAADIKKSKADQAAGIKMNAAKVYLRGDENINGIAMQFGVSPNAIRQANPGMNLDDLKGRLGTAIIVPSGKFTMQNTPGSVIPEQVIAVHYEPEKSSSQIPTGSEIDVNNI